MIIGNKMRKEIEKIIDVNYTVDCLGIPDEIDTDKMTDQICSLLIERLEATKKEVEGFPAVYVCDIDKLIKELRDGKRI